MTSILLASLLTACSGEAASPEADHGEASHENHEKDHGATDKHAEHDKHGDAAMAMAKPTEGAKVVFGEPAEGAKLKSPVKVVMVVEGMEVKPAGELIEGAGHHHIIVDSEPVKFGEAVPADDKHIHFGKGQTETELELEPGEHTLQLQFADGMHRSYGESMTTQITIVVE